MSRQFSISNEAADQSIVWITRRIALGRYLTPERAKCLQKAGVTHVLNVGDNSSTVDAYDYEFVEIADFPIEDLTLIPSELAIRSIAKLDSFLQASPDNRVYVHCLAGQQRSPTVLWLYLVARGVAEERAKQLITDRAFDAVPGHRALIDEQLVQTVIAYGRKHFLQSGESDLQWIDT